MHEAVPALTVAKRAKAHRSSAHRGPARHTAADRTTPLQAQSDGHAAGAGLASIGAEVRRNRAKRGMTRRQLAMASNTSERYLAQIEGGAGNPSVTVLRAIARALDLPTSALLGEPSARTSAHAALLDLIARLPEQELPELTKLIETRVKRSDRADRGRRIALVGLRGAGKSTLGRMLARHLGWPFIELDRAIEEDYGASIPDIIEMAGTATFRRLERAALDSVIAGHDAAIVTTAGGIVSDPESYGLLLRRCHTIWIKARPQDHMSRVMAQGDFRPMAQNREAMSDLVAILEARSADYARAEAELDTSADAVERSFAKLLRIVTNLLGSAATTASTRPQRKGNAKSRDAVR
jgi:XRE family transcriptional regulator, aerobic/anaerobic benzoate catabolism transcriptional regulator